MLYSLQNTKRVTEIQVGDVVLVHNSGQNHTLHPLRSIWRCWLTKVCLVVAVDYYEFFGVRFPGRKLTLQTLKDNEVIIMDINTDDEMLEI